MSHPVFFERAFVINLASRTDRKRQMRRELGSVNMGRLDVEYFAAIRPEEPDGFTSVGVRGCFLSHFEIAKRAAQLGLKSYLVMEDDVKFTRAMQVSGVDLLNQLLATPWDLAFVGHGGPSMENASATWVPLYDRRFGTHCYAVHSRMYDALINYMDLVALRPVGHPEGGKLNADALFTFFCKLHPQFRMLQSQPNLAVQRSSASDISPGWIDRNIFTRPVAGAMRSFWSNREQ